MAVYFEIPTASAIVLSNSFRGMKYCVPVRCCLHPVPRGVAQAPQRMWQDIPTLEVQENKSGYTNRLFMCRTHCRWQFGTTTIPVV